MTRSLSFPYLFIILAVSYLGGTLLFRQLTEESVVKVLRIVDARIVSGGEANMFYPILMVILFFGLILVCARFTYSRPLVKGIAAIKCVLFGMSSAYLLAKGLKVYAYAFWWFPFQFILCFALLLFASVLAPPFFLKTTGKKERNPRTLFVLLIVSTMIVVAENLIFYFWVS